MERADASAVRSLQRRLAHADPDIVDAAVSGPFRGFVAVKGAVVGYAIAFPGTPTTLSELVVAPGSRRQGHGSALLERVATATDPERIVVSTPVGNEAAREFYTESGFEVDATIEGFYDDGTDALRLLRFE